MIRPPPLFNGRSAAGWVFDLDQVEHLADHLVCYASFSTLRSLVVRCLETQLFSDSGFLQMGRSLAGFGGDRAAP